MDVYVPHQVRGGKGGAKPLSHKRLPNLEAKERKTFYFFHFNNMKTKFEERRN